MISMFNTIIVLIIIIIIIDTQTLEWYVCIMYMNGHKDATELSTHMVLENMTTSF